MTQLIRKAIIPIGGLGTRLLPATKAVPKELLPIVDKPLIQFAVEEALASGIEELIFVTRSENPAIKDYFEASPELKALLKEKGKNTQLQALESMMPQPGSLRYACQPEPLGLGHAVWCAREFIHDEPFAVILPDDFVIAPTPCLKQMCEAYDTSMGSMVATMEVPEAEVNKYGILDVVKEEGNCLYARGMVEKPDPSQAPSRTAVIGRYILTPEVMKSLDHQETGAGGEIQLTDAIARTIKDDNLCGFRFEGTRYDCGGKEGLLEATLAYSLTRDDLKGIAQQFIAKQRAA